MKLMKQKIKEINLPFWQDPQCYVFTQHQRHDVTIFCRIWDKKRKIIKNRLGKIHFKNAIACVIERKVINYLCEDCQSYSAILEVKNSIYLKNYTQNRQICDISSQELENYRHFVVHSHDHQVVVLAKDFSAKIVKVKNKVRPIYRTLIND